MNMERHRINRENGLLFLTRPYKLRIEVRIIGVGFRRQVRVRIWSDQTNGRIVEALLRQVVILPDSPRPRWRCSRCFLPRRLGGGFWERLLPSRLRYRWAFWRSLRFRSLKPRLGPLLASQHLYSSKDAAM